MPSLLLVASWLLVAWGALAFGAVYPWAWRPLVTGCAVVGAASWLVARPFGARADDRGLLLALGGIAAVGLLQLVPLPRDARVAISPASETVLLEQDFEYAFAARMTGLSDDRATAQVPAALPKRPLSLNPAATARALVLLAGLALLLGGLTRLLNVTGARRLTTWIVILGVALALIGIVQRALLGDHAYGGMKIYGVWTPANLLTTPFGPFVNRNHFAGWMLMGLPLAMGLGLGWAGRAARLRGQGWRDALRWISAEETGKLQLAAIALAVMGVALLMTKSRSGVGGFALAMSLAAVVVGRRASGLARWAALGGLAVLLAGVFATAGTDATERFTTGAGSIELRKRIWRDSASVVRDFPLVGTGLNTFGTAMLSYQTSQRESHFQEAHNDYLQVLVEGGLLLAVPVALAAVALAGAIRRRFVEGRDDTMTHWIRVGATTGLVAIGAQSLVEFSLQMPGNAVLCAVLMAIALHVPPARSRNSGGRGPGGAPAR